MTPTRNKFGVLQGQQFDETEYDLQRTIASTGMVQMGRSQTLHGRADDWFPLYADPGEIPAP